MGARARRRRTVRPARDACETRRSGRERWPFLSADALWSNQEWALDGTPGAEDLVEYECRFNYIWPKYDDVVVCVYDSSRFDADLLVQILRTHPFSIVGGVLRENPFYVPPDQLLRELRVV